MKRIFILLIIISSAVWGYSQNIKQTVSQVSQISSLPNLEQHNDTLYTLHCGDPIIWQIMSLGTEAIPFLIEMIKDSSHAKATLKCSVNGTRVGDLAFFILDRIINIPLAQITGHQFCTYTDCGGFFMPDGVFYLLAENRTQLSAQIERWYTGHKKEIEFVDFKNSYSYKCFTTDKVEVDFGLHK